MTKKELDELPEEISENEPDGPLDDDDDINPLCITRIHVGKIELIEGVLTSACLKVLLRKNLIAFPTISEDEINDKSKGDALSKGIACS